jgi:hypothetical protein
MMPAACNALRGAVLAIALIALLTAPAYPQASPEAQKRYEAEKKARELKAQEDAYKSASDVIPAQQPTIDPWANVRSNPTPPPKPRR